jgi:molybdopterin-guanine dinucleotide biosynthesis protein A
MSLRVGGIVLAGGGSRRMGADKALLRVEGDVLAVRVAAALRAAGCEPLVVVRGEDQPDPGVPGAELVRDGTAGLGPLEGIRTGLAALEGRSDAAVVAPVDAPRLEPELVRALLRALAAHPEVDAVVPSVDGRVQPLTAVYRVALHAEAARLLGDGDHRARALVERARTLILDEAALLADAALRRADPGLASLDDVDAPDDLARLGIEPQGP